MLGRECSGGTLLDVRAGGLDHLLPFLGFGHHHFAESVGRTNQRLAAKIISPERCSDVPLPDDGKFTLPGLAFTKAMNSATVLAGTSLLTVITFGTRLNDATGAISRTKLIFRLVYSDALLLLAGLTSS